MDLLTLVSFSGCRIPGLHGRRWAGDSRQVVPARRTTMSEANHSLWVLATSG
jgi:hypothetical protein